MGGYPSRALRTPGFLYIRNYTPERWPNGTPDWENAALLGTWYGDTDNGPTKTYMVDHKDDDDEHRQAWELSFGKRPAEELYDLAKDPDQLHNVAGDPAYKGIKDTHAIRLTRELVKTADPRESPKHSYDFDAQPYLGGGPRHPDASR